jgi:carbamoyl-phosphate synthase large subunit
MISGTSAPRILFSSLSSKIALYDAVLRQAKSFHPGASLVGADCNKNCPGANSVKSFMFLPKLGELSDHDLTAFLSKAGITHILPTRDGELQYWSSRTNLLLTHNVIFLGSSLNAINICEDKFIFFQEIFPSGFKVIPCFRSPDDSEFKKWVVKERRGSSSKGLLLSVDKFKAAEFGASLSEPIYQPYIAGKEFTAEGWINRNGECMAILLRWRDKVVNGESFVSTTFRNTDWENKIKTLFSSINGLKGHCLGQFIVDHDENLNLVEINPRLGGASPLSLSSGLNSILWSLREESGKQFSDSDFQPLFETKLTKLNGQVFISYPN